MNFIKVHRYIFRGNFKKTTFGLQKKLDPDFKIKNFIIFNAKYFIFSS